jgi:hypothetical protein
VQRRQDGKWLFSAVLAILNNPLYTGLVRHGQSFSHTLERQDNGKRCPQPAPEQMLQRHDGALRIIPDTLWQRVKRRQAEQSHKVGVRVKAGLAAQRTTGTKAMFLLSGLLRCAHCGSSYAIAGKDRYSCTGHTGGGNSLCSNNAILRRQAAERAVLAGIRRAMQSQEVIDEICRRYRAARRNPKSKAPDVTEARMIELRAQVDNLADAIATGALRNSPALATRLAAAERELAELAESRAPVPLRLDTRVTPLLTDLPARVAQAVERLEETLTQTLAAGDIARARSEIRAHVGTVKVEADAREVRLYSEQGVAVALLRAVGGPQASLVGSGGRI